MRHSCGFRFGYPGRSVPLLGPAKPEREKVLSHFLIPRGQGQRIKELRAEAGWTQASLADAMKPYFKWTRITVAEIETETRRLTLEELLLLAALFGEPMVSFLIPTDNTWLEPPSRDIYPDHLREMVLGAAGSVGSGGSSWKAASQVATDPAPRPAADLWRRRSAGAGPDAPSDIPAPTPTNTSRRSPTRSGPPPGRPKKGH